MHCCRYDLVIDSDLNVWLIEINCSPAMDASTKVQIYKLTIRSIFSCASDNGAPVHCGTEGRFQPHASHLQDNHI